MACLPGDTGPRADRQSPAIGRRQDQLILDALSAASGTGTVANSIGGSNTNMNISKLREAAKILNAKNVPSDGRHIIIHANSLAAMLEQTSVTSSDFNTVKALVQGEINQYMGFTFHVLGDRSEGGLPIDGSSDRTLFAFHKDAIGYAEGIAPRTEINYVPEKTSWLVNALFSAGASPTASIRLRLRPTSRSRSKTRSTRRLWCCRCRGLLPLRLWLPSLRLLPMLPPHDSH